MDKAEISTATQLHLPRKRA